MTVVLFAGMGGGCDGLEQAGFPVHLAINHDPVAIAVHQKRHPHTVHLQSDVFEVDPRQACKGRGVRVLHASPDCRHFSVAKGSKPVSKRVRSLAWVICRWAGQVRPETITLENVREITTWSPLIAKRDPATGRVLKLDGTVAAKGERVPVEQQWLVPDPKKKGKIWRAFERHIREHLGYSFEWRVICCADFGVPTIRTRLFGVMRADGGPIVWPERTHAPRKDAKRLGLKSWIGAHTIIDWSLPVKSIFGRQKPLAEATLRRVARGVMRYVVEAPKPFIVPITHTRGSNGPRSADLPLSTITTARGGENVVAVPSLAGLAHGDSGSRREYGIDEPVTTVHAGGGNLALVSATVVGAGARAAQTEPRDLEEPMGSGTTKEDRILVAASLIQTGYGERDGQAPRTLDIEEPAGTQVAGGSKAALVAAFLAQHNNDSRRIGGVHPGREPGEPLATLTVQPQVGIVTATLGEMRGASVARNPDEPLAAVSASGGHAHLILAFLQQYYGTGGMDQPATDPLHAVTAKARHGLVEVKVARETRILDDIGIRMLEPEEGAAAHGFGPKALPAEIVIDGVTRRLTKTEKYHLVGNSVPPLPIQLLAELNVRRELMVAAE